MPKFDLLDPDHLPTDAQLLLRSRAPDSTKYEHFFITFRGHFLIYKQALHEFPKTGRTKWIRDQSEFPLAIVRWIPWALEEKFFKGPTEGGIAAGSIHYKDTVGGEAVVIERSVNPPGYGLLNLCRYSYIAEDEYQEVQLTDQWLFDAGLLEQFKEWARQYEAGTL